ncbi:MAG: hypothetical protein RR034_04965, partial [Bacteroidales bacterium]
TSAAVVVGVMTDKNNATTFVPIDTVKPTASSTWFEAEIDLDSYTQNGHFIALKTYFTSTFTPLYIDNVVVRPISSCKRPDNLTVSNILHNSADISFTTYNGESSWEIAYGPAGFNPDAEDAQIVSAHSNPFTLTGLDDATYYECYVRSNCENESSFWSFRCSFTTTCLSFYTAPFASNFSTGVPPLCWNRYGVSASRILDSTRTLDLFPTTSGWTMETGNGIVEPHAKVNVFGSSCQYWLVTPIIDITELTTPYLYFDLALTDFGNDNPIENLNAQADDKFMVAVSTDGGASWTTENTILWSNAGGADHIYNRISRGGEMISIPLTHYLDNGSSLRFAFYVESTVSGGDNDLHIGNILISDEISCFKAQQPKVTALTGNSIRIGWTIQSTTETQWEVAYGRKGFDLNSDTAVIETVTTNTYLIENLETNTKYDIYLRTICDGTPTRWAKKLTVLTSQQDYESVPYTCNFEDPTQNAGWQFVRNTSATAVNNWAIDTAVHFGDEAQGHALYISKDNGVTNEYNMAAVSNVWAYRDIYFTEGVEYLLTFKWKAKGESSYDCLKVYIGIPDTAANSSTVPVGATLLSTTPLSSQSSWQNAEYVLSGAQYAGTMQRLYFYWKNDASSGNNPPAAIDDITISEIVCGRPNLVRSLNYTPNGADITFEPASSSDNQWELVYGRVGFDPDQATPIEITASLYTLTNLLPGTFYEVYVRTNCGDRTSIWSSVHSFRTSCGTIATLPFIENMDTYTTGATSFPVCWTRNSTSSTSYPQISSSYTHSSPRSLYFNLSDSVITNNLITTPEFDASIPINSLMVSFWMYKNSNAGHFKVGVMSNPLDITTFETIQTFNNNISPTAYQEVSLAGYTGNGHYIAFLFDSTIVNHNSNMNHSVYLDDLKIRTIPTCSRPSDLTVVDVLQTEAILSWTSHGSETEWELMYDTIAFNPDMGLVGQIVSATSTPFTLTNLEFNKTYYVCVRAKCSDSDLSEWCLNNVSFTTLCSSYQFPFTENFANTTFPTTCWQKWSGWVDSTVISGGSWNRVDNNNGINGTHVKLNIYGLSTKSWLVSPPIDLSTAVHPKLYFDLALTDYGNDDAIEHSGTQTDDKFMVLVSSDFGATWSQRTIWNNSLENPGDYVYDLIYHKAKTIEIDLQNFATASNPIMIAFYGESTVSGGDNDLHIGNIRISEPISCMKPYALQLDSTSNSELMISWSQGRDETAYDVAYGLPGFNLNDENSYTLLTNVMDTFAVINGLIANATYEIYVRSNCGSDVSEWTLPERYKTAPILATIPYVCNFEDENENRQWLFANNSSATASNWYIDTAVNSIYDTNGTHALYISN